MMVNGTETDESVCVPSKPRLSQQDIRIIIGCTIGGALLLVAAASFLVARFSRRRAEERYRLPLSQAEKRAADMQQEVLQQSELNAVISHEGTLNVLTLPAPLFSHHKQRHKIPFKLGFLTGGNRLPRIPFSRSFSANSNECPRRCSPPAGIDQALERPG